MEAHPLAAHHQSAEIFCSKISFARGQISEHVLPMRNHHRCIAVYIPLPVPRCSCATGRTSTAAVARQPVLWDSSVSRDGAGQTCYTGPRGGTYTITASDRKNYGGC